MNRLLYFACIIIIFPIINIQSVKIPLCPLNEEYATNACQNTCENPALSIIGKTTYPPGCVCKKGFLRNSKNICVLPHQCENGCGGDKNAMWIPCGDNCPITCENKDNPPTVCTLGCKLEGGCKCKEGFVRNNQGKCIPPNECPKSIVCKENEEVDQCPSPCTPEVNCESYFNPIKIACPVQSNRICVPKCRCKSGFVRISNGNCESPKVCCTDPNSELIANPNPCPGGTCDTPEHIPCKIKASVAGCQCKEGYLKKSNTDPTCIPESQCPKIPVCPVNEEYSECGNNACQNTCKNPNIAKTCRPKCVSGCICVQGYLRNTKGVCVPCSQCDTCKDNEVFDACGNNECINTCESPNNTVTCKPKGCNPGCICQPGFVRNKNGECIRPQLCIPGTCNGDPNAEYNPCGNTCPITCENKDDKTPRMCPLLCILGGGCTCKKGFVQDKKGACIPPGKCPKCGANERFNCGSACDTTCATLGEDCPIKNIKCVERCYCIEGYARDPEGICIPIEKCSPKVCPTDPNAMVVKCPNPCPKTCANLNDPPKDCSKMCLRFGCQCNEGHVLNSVGKCVLPNCCS